MKKEKQNKIKTSFSISTKAFAIPIVAILSVILIFMILVVVDINYSSNKVFDLMQRSGNYKAEATSIQASNTVMSETCTNYMLMPVNEDSSINYGPLMTYVNELNSDRRSPKVLARFKEYDVSYEVLLCIEKASELSEQIKDIQIHAIAVMASVHNLPNLPEFSIFLNEKLTQEELDMSLGERETYARKLILESDYAKRRFYVNENIDKCNSLLQDEFNETSSISNKHIAEMRDILWISISFIVLTLNVSFILLHFYIFKPLREYSKQIAANKSIKRRGRLSEMRELVDAFNGLWNYRNNLESILRVEAENDSLTGLPNRYCMEHDLLKTDYNNKPVSILMFDVNFLKKTNDTKGHLAGDKLIKTTAMCITECFSIDKINNCYRIGGDEFIAIMPCCTEDDIKRRIDKFKLATIREDISVSVGYAYTDRLDDQNFKSLMEEADKNMYENKKIVHNIVS